MFEFIDAEHAAATSASAIDCPPATRMCTWLEVSRSGFYEWRSRPESATTRRREELKLYVQKSFDLSDGSYGYRRVHADLGYGV
jgi:putative transposase